MSFHRIFLRGAIAAAGSQVYARLALNFKEGYSLPWRYHASPDELVLKHQK
jgi:hypothetical protein